MKVYAPDLLDTWPDDAGPAQLPTGLHIDSLFASMYNHACSELNAIATTVKNIKQEEDEEIFDHLYRRAHVLYGFAFILKLPRATHLLAILDFVCDYARKIESFEQHSMDYLVHLLGATTQAVLTELHSDRCSTQELGDIFDECRTYLSKPLAECLSPVDPQQVVSHQVVESEMEAVGPSEHPASESDVAEPAAEVAPASAAAPIKTAATTIADEPENVDIPADKVGLVSDFCEESRENLIQIGQQLIELEDDVDPIALVNDLFRSVHTIKGGARLLQIRKIETLSHQLESLLDEVRGGVRKVTSDLIDILLDGKKLLEDMIEEVAANGPISTGIASCLDAIATLRGDGGTAPAIAKKTESQPTSPPADLPAEQSATTAAKETPADTALQAPAGAAKSKVAVSGETVRVPTEKLDDVLNNASEIFTTRIRLQNDITTIKNTIQQFKQTLQQLNEFDSHSLLDRLAESNRHLIKDLSDAMNGVSVKLTTENLALLVNRFHDELARKLSQQVYSAPAEIMLHLLSIEEVQRNLQKNVEHLDRLSERLQSGAMRFRMVPIASLFDRFPAQVRELGRQVGKKIKLEVSGADTELDKVMINHLNDPLLHMFRNAVDHGIEEPEERKRLGKPETGQLKLKAYYHGSHAVIELSDDGRGMDVEKIRAKAVERKLVEPEVAVTLGAKEVLSFIFEPGFSMAAKVSNLSGRGVGMDVVKTAISEVQGSIAIDSTHTKGTKICLKLPLTLAVVGLLLVEERFNQFALPILNVEEIITLDKSAIRRFGDDVVYNYRGSALPVTTLSNILDFPSSAFSDHKISLVILSEGNNKIGIMVDKICGRQEMLIKNLGRLIKKVPFVMGCTILSDSRLISILNAWDIVNAKMPKLKLNLSTAADQAHSARNQHKILVVDDSAIQRKDLSATLTHAGYDVATAENGFEGLKAVRQQHYSAFCVDIIMPLVDGFEFIERLRRLPGYRDAPVIFITGQSSQYEKERAANLGVKEFLTKPVEEDKLISLLDSCCLQAVKAGQTTGESPMGPT